jgi:hypothetical protein
MLKLISTTAESDQEACRLDLKGSIEQCEGKFRQILTEIQEGSRKEAHEMEALIFKRLLELGLFLLNVFFVTHNQGNYGETIKTEKGIAKRGRVTERSYFSVFGKLRIVRYLYHRGSESFAPLDSILNLPKRCYSYFLSEMVSILDIKGAYEEGVLFFKRFFSLTLSVAAAETIAKESSQEYGGYYDSQDSSGPSEKAGQLTVVSFDGKGVPMIKKEAAKIKGRQGKGEKRQKKKEALVGVKYTIDPHPRTPEEVANNLVYPENREHKEKQNKAEDIRYIASVEQPKKEVMEEIRAALKDKRFDTEPLICVMDGANCIWRIFREVFGEIKNKVLILDIIHVLEYLWLIGHTKYKEGSDKARHYVYEKLLLILQGKVSCYIIELQNEMSNGKWKKGQIKSFKKVITYLKNHKEYMNYDQYLSSGYPIGTGVVESACSHVVKNRMELSGARWGISGAESILRLRSIAKSNDWDEYWKFYTQQARSCALLPAEANSLNLQQKRIA